jgi:starvation-inducible DNA-binding protein
VEAFTFASDIAETNDEIAERAVTLGAIVTGTVRDAATSSTLPDYPPGTTRDLEHVRLLAKRFDVYLEGLRHARGLAEEAGDIDTVDLLTARITLFEKHGWFLRATLAG